MTNLQLNGGQISKSFLAVHYKNQCMRGSKMNCTTLLFLPSRQKAVEQNLCPTSPPTHTALCVCGGNLNLHSSTKSRADTLNPRAEFSLSGAHRGWHQILTLWELKGLHSGQHLADTQQPKHFCKSSRFPDLEGDSERNNVCRNGNCCYSDMCRKRCTCVKRALSTEAVKLGATCSWPFLWRISSCVQKQLGHM